MADGTELLAALQHADSFFPGGGTAFSWGLEALCADRQVTSSSDVRQFLEGQIRNRWATCDRLFLVASHRVHGDLDAVAVLDRRLEAMTLPRELREGAARAGAALLNIHERLETPGASAYRTLVRSGLAPGHLPVVQGLVLAGCGLGEAAATAISAHALTVNVVGAALRLSVISHVDAQRILTDLRRLVAGILARPVDSVGESAVYTPATDAAAMRHEVQSGRLFAN